MNDDIKQLAQQIREASETLIRRYTQALNAKGSLQHGSNFIYSDAKEKFEKIATPENLIKLCDALENK
ncbi:hypothetical protein [Xenorhabdus sp. KJ12.1]|uniref:hypothetical protein n=1 Tax=Xenorhabdus sp. KJ12.1 TaxID=1851571 RepID=UPI000C03F066|nr:hypothetical protein [Xenorhabdus sp. KJ12.1]PHM72261.1 hypothetical protein Xekj_00539 [Xenorhabdus sp. KJ12.1]